MKICLSANSSWHIVNFRANIVRALVAEGYEVIVIAPKDDYSERIADLGCGYVEIPIEQQGMSVAADLRTFLTYLKILRKEKPDVFLGYTVKPNIYGSLACHLLKIPVVNDVPGLGTAFLRGGWLERVVTTLYRLAFSASRTIFFQNCDDQKLFMDSQLVREEQSKLLPGTGVDLSCYQQCAYEPRPKERMQFLFVGRILRDKGVCELVEAARQIKIQYPKVEVQLLGPTGVANRTALTAEEVKKWHNEGVIRYLGVTDAVLPFMQDADCVVLPSYREGTPCVLLEAGALSRPLVATDVPGCRQVVDHGVNGYLCRSQDAVDLAEKMLQMIELSEVKKLAMSRACRKKIEKEYDEKIVIHRYLEEIQSLLSCKLKGLK